MRIVGISGSLRSGSYNSGLLQAAREEAPSGVDFIITPIGDLPMYSPQTESEAPAAVVRFWETLRDADAVLIATPEYNHSIPGVLANALDWASRPARRSAMVGMPTGMMSASPGAIGGARAQEHLKLILSAMLARTVPHAGVVVGRAHERFESEVLTDDRTRQFISSYVAELVDWAALVRSAPVAA